MTAQPSTSTKTNRKAIKLDAPRTLGQEPLYTLETTVRQQFSKVMLLKDGKELAVIIAKDKKKQTKIGEANHSYLCGLILGALSGRGDAPGGACLWTSTNAQKMKSLDQYTLLAVPDKRGSTIEATVADFVKVVHAKANMIRVSMEKHPIEKRIRETKTGSEDEQIEVWL